MPKHPDTQITHARDLRREARDAEQRLWLHLRDRQLAGFKFRRQHSIGPYVVDFYCAEAHLGIELDRGQHYQAETMSRDEVRSQYLRERGVRVMRFSDRDLLIDPESVLTFLVAVTGRALLITIRMGDTPMARANAAW